MDELIDQLAEELGVPYRTRLKWRQRRVPFRRREDIRDLAAKRGLIITREAFDTFGRPAQSEPERAA